MPHDSQFFDYEPVTRRRGANAPEVTKDDERFSVPQRRAPRSESDAAGDWSNPDPLLRRADDENRPPAPAPNSSQTKPRTPVRRGDWILRRGHTLSFVGVFLFTITLYFRPYELIRALSSFKSLAYWIAASTLLIFLPSQFVVEGNLTARPREVKLILLLSLAALLSVPLALNRAEAWATFVEFLKVILIFIVMVNVMRTERRLKTLMWLALAVGCVVSIGAVNDYRVGHFAARGERIAGVIGGMFLNSNDMALHLVIMTPIAIALFFSTRSLLMKAFYGASVAVMIAGNLVTFSRGGLLGLVGALAVLLWKLGRRHRLLVFVLALSLMFSLIAFMPATMIERIVTTFDPNSGTTAAGSTTSRTALLFRSLQVMIRHPLLGIGMGNFHSVSIREQVTHNSYTQVGAEIGIPAMVFYTLFIVAAFKRMLRIERETAVDEHHSRFYYLSAGLQASLVGFMIGSFFLSVAYLHYLYYLIGYAICLDRVYELNRPATTGLVATTENKNEREEAGGRIRRAAFRETQSRSR